MLIAFKAFALFIGATVFTFAVIFASSSMFGVAATRIGLRDGNHYSIIIAVCMTLVAAAFINDLFFWLADRLGNRSLRILRQVPLGSGPEGAMGAQVRPLAIYQKLLVVYPLLFFMMLAAYILVVQHVGM